MMKANNRQLQNTNHIPKEKQDLELNLKSEIILNNSSMTIWPCWGDNENMMMFTMEVKTAL